MAYEKGETYLNSKQNNLFFCQIKKKYIKKLLFNIFLCASPSTFVRRNTNTSQVQGTTLVSFGGKGGGGGEAAPGSRMQGDEK